jgi:hypothetical protein
VDGNFSLIKRNAEKIWWDLSERPDAYTWLSDENGDGEIGIYKDNPEYPKAVRNLTHEVIQQRIDALRSEPAFYSFGLEAAKEYLRTDVPLLELINTLINNFKFFGYQDISVTKKTRDLLNSLALQSLSTYYSRSTDTTLAFIGYGKEMAFPGTLSISCRGLYAGRLLFKGLNFESTLQVPFMSNDIDEFTKAIVDTFAQRETIFGVLNGFTPDIYYKIENNLRESLERISSHIITFDSSHNREEFISSTIESVMDDVYRADEYSYLTPEYENSFSAMGLSNLREISELLIKLQSLAAFGKSEMNTVGGLVETLTIDKIFGVRWHVRVPIPQ